MRLTGIGVALLYETSRVAVAAASACLSWRPRSLTREDHRAVKRRRVEGLIEAVEWALSVTHEKMAVPEVVQADPGISVALKNHAGVLEAALHYYCSIYDVLFQEQGNEMNGGGYHLAVNADFVLVDPPYNVRRTIGQVSAENNVLTRADMSALGDFIADVMCMEAHEHIFCADVQFGDCMDVLSAIEEFVTCHDAESTEQAINELLFGVKPKQLVYVRYGVYYQQHPASAW